MKCPSGCICKRHIGHPQSPEVRAIIGATHAGKPKSPEHRAKLATAMREQWARHEGPAPNLGVPMSAETRARMSIGRQGNQNAWRHGMVGTRTHTSWRDMLARCYQPGNPSFASYAGRGITVCESWKLFENFLADMGERPPRMTLDRINNDGNYEPGNCRWATAAQQRANQRPRKKVIADVCR